MNRMVTTATERQAFGDDKVRVSITLPALHGKEKTKLSAGFSSYYGGMKTGFLRFAKEALLKRAKNAEAPFGAVLKAVISYENESTVSVYVDAAVSTDAGRKLTRLPQLWDKESGTLIRAESLYEKRGTARLLPLIERGVLARVESAAAPLYSDWKQILKRELDKSRFYISPRGMVFFYPAEVLSERNEIFPVHISANELTAVLKESVYKRLWLE